MAWKGISRLSNRPIYDFIYNIVLSLFICIIKRNITYYIYIYISIYIYIYIYKCLMRFWSFQALPEELRTSSAPIPPSRPTKRDWCAFPPYNIRGRTWESENPGARTTSHLCIQLCYVLELKTCPSSWAKAAWRFSKTQMPRVHAFGSSNWARAVWRFSKTRMPRLHGFDLL